MPFDDTVFLKKSVEVLSFFNEEQLRRITPDIERVDYRAGQTVVMRGEVTSAFYILKSGRAVAVYKGKAGAVTAELKAGDFFGEMSLLEDMPSDAKITACEDGTTILTIPSASFRQLLEMQPLLKQGLAARAAQRRQASSTPPQP